MSNRPALITQADANRLLKAAKSAGYDRVRFLTYPDGRSEVVAETACRLSDKQSIDANEWDEVLR
jgi:hypothetical protein